MVHLSCRVQWIFLYFLKKSIIIIVQLTFFARTFSGVKKILLLCTPAHTHTPRHTEHNTPLPAFQKPKICVFRMKFFFLFRSYLCWWGSGVSFKLWVHHTFLKYQPNCKIMLMREVKLNDFFVIMHFFEKKTFVFVCFSFLLCLILFFCFVRFFFSFLIFFEV